MKTATRTDKLISRTHGQHDAATDEVLSRIARCRALARLTKAVASDTAEG